MNFDPAFFLTIFSNRYGYNTEIAHFVALKASSQSGRRGRRLRFKGKNEGGKDGDGKPGHVKDILCMLNSNSVYPPGLQQIPLSANTK